MADAQHNDHDVLDYLHDGAQNAADANAANRYAVLSRAHAFR